MADMRLAPPLLLALSLLLAGCMAPDAPAASGPEADLTSSALDPASEGEPAPATPSNAGAGKAESSKPASSAPATGATSPSGGRAPQDFAWAPIEEAIVRPGVQVVGETGQCTANFLFTRAAPDGATDVYVGLAAHCVDGLELGAPLDIAGGGARGSLAYSSWRTMDEVGEKDADALEYNDFALILLDRADREKANPAMRHFGGPIGLAACADASTGDKVLTYGNSGLRPPAEPLSWHEGYIVASSAWTSTVYTATPGIPGDSGSGVLDAQGRALGVVVTLTIAPTVGSNGVTHLDMALAYAKQHAGLDASLATAELLDAGLLPAAD